METGAPIGALEVKLLGNYDRPTYQPTNQLTNRHMTEVSIKRNR